MHDFMYLRLFFCKGVGIDETFAIAAKGRLCEYPDGLTRQYVEANKMLHTMMSCQTNQVAGVGWLDNKVIAA